MGFNREARQDGELYIAMATNLEGDLKRLEIVAQDPIHANIQSYRQLKTINFRAVAVSIHTDEYLRSA